MHERRSERKWWRKLSVSVGMNELWENESIKLDKAVYIETSCSI